ncbi:MAG: hypothetical protein HC896_11300 [Bacteroidales bacterium]|nr:hypothetical protein [Bacteroidales bacterium]
MYETNNYIELIAKVLTKQANPSDMDSFDMLMENDAAFREEYLEYTQLDNKIKAVNQVAAINTGHEWDLFKASLQRKNRKHYT